MLDRQLHDGLPILLNVFHLEALKAAAG